MSLDPTRRAGLERARALAIARDHFDLDVEEATVDAAPFGVSIRVGGSDATTAVIVSSVDDLSVLGGALVWLDRNPMERVHLIVEHHAGIHARRAAVLAPELVVHQLVGSDIRPAVAAPVEDPHPVPDDVVPLVAMIERSGAQVGVVKRLQMSPDRGQVTPRRGTREGPSRVGSSVVERLEGEGDQGCSSIASGDTCGLENLRRLGQQHGGEVARHDGGTVVQATITRDHER